MSPHPSSALRSGATAAPLWAAALLPALLAFNQPPSPTLFNQLAAVGCWGLVLVMLAGAQAAGVAVGARRSAALQAALALVCASVLWSWGGGVLPSGLALSALGLLVMVMALALAGSVVPASGVLMSAFFAAWLLAGALSSLIAIVQVFAPTWPDGDWIARSTLPGRAVGNLRQPNHLSSLLLWSAVAVVPLLETQRLRRGLAVALFALMVLGITLSGSRTGWVGVGVLALWGLFDRRLTRFSRGLLLAAPLLCAASWGLLAWWSSHGSEHALGAAARLGEGDISSSRFAIWRDALALIARHPWLGVGFGEFNFAWTLTPFPHRPTAFFDHTHNLPLQLAVELGLPLAAAALMLLAVALWQAARRAWAAPGVEGAGLRAAFVMVLMMALHSQLEYPLWYAYFLLPTAFVWGLCLGARPRDEVALEGVVPRANRVLLLGGIGMVMTAGVVLVDYLRVVAIFSPPQGAAPLEQRITEGRRSWFFAHHADYAAATTADEPAEVMSAFDRAPHYLLDTRLMVAWARALAEQGDVERARHIAARLREFRNPNAKEFFAECDEAGIPAEARPFQCTPPTPAMDWRDFRRR